jgi:hypothetical protein
MFTGLAERRSYTGVMSVDLRLCRSSRKERSATISETARCLSLLTKLTSNVLYYSRTSTCAWMANEHGGDVKKRRQKI